MLFRSDTYSTLIVEGVRHGVLIEKEGSIEAVDPVTKNPIKEIDAKPLPEFIQQLQESWPKEEKIRKAVIYAATGALCLYQ